MNARTRSAAGLAAAIAGGAALGAIVFAPGLGLAAGTSTSTTAAPAAAPATVADGKLGRLGFRADLFAVAADTLGLEKSQVRDALRDGSSLAALAEEQGVETQALIDALVAASTAAIDDAVADGDIAADRAETLKEDLDERIADLVAREGLPDRGRGGLGGGPGGGGLKESLAVAAETLGLSEDELRAALEDGTSLAAVAEQEGVAVETLVDALVADATTRIQERTDKRIEQLPERIAELVERTPGEGRPDDAPEDEPSPSTSGT